MRNNLLNNSFRYVTSIVNNEKKITRDLFTINAQQLERQEHKTLQKSLPSRQKEIKRKLKIKSSRKSNSFFNWLFSNTEK